MQPNNKHVDSIFDIVGIGTGPANLALASAIKEHNDKQKREKKLKYLFLDKQTSFKWQPEMLLPEAKLQVPFFRDIATLRDPTSKYTFLNYLKENDRLDDFINLRDFYPTRYEFQDYLQWVCYKLKKYIFFDTAVTKVSVDSNNKLKRALSVSFIDNPCEEKLEKTIKTKNVVVATGKTPFLPIDILTPRVTHSCNFLASLHKFYPDLNQDFEAIVVGSGQSSGEIVQYLYDYYPHCKITWCFKGYNLTSIDSNPFVNKEYHQQSVNCFYMLSQNGKNKAKESLNTSNYAGIDQDILNYLNAKLYQDKLYNRNRLILERGLKIIQANTRGSSKHIEGEFWDELKDDLRKISANLIILATGYCPPKAHPLLLPCHSSLQTDNYGHYIVDSNYRTLFKNNSSFNPGIYLNGYCEDSHGPSDPTLSTLATKAENILKSIITNTRSI